MKNNLNDEELWRIIGFLKVSTSRLKTLNALKNNFLMPSEISRKTDLSQSQVSTSLHDLKKNNLVMCMNEKTRKGRIYHATDLGLELLEIINENEKH